MAEIKISCPNCGQHIQCDEDYQGRQIPCPACGQPFVIPQSSQPMGTPTVPRISIHKSAAPPVQEAHSARPASGYAHQFKNFPVAAVILLHFLTCGLFSLVWLNGLHGRLPRVRPDDPSGGKAVGFCFIPFFNLYWIFFTFRRLCLRIDEQRELHGLAASNLRGTATTTSVMLVIPYVNALLGFIIALPVFAAQLQHSVNQLVAQTAVTGPQPTPGSKAPPSGGSGWIVALVILCGFLLVPVLAAMIFPALAAGKARAAEIRCVNNQKQLALAIRQYASEHNNRFPVAGNWCDAIKASVLSEDIFRCPSAIGVNNPCDFAFNSRLSGRPENTVNPQTVMLFETKPGWNISGGPELLTHPPRHRSSNRADCVITFADGSVHIVPVSQLGSLRWNP